MKDRCEGSGGTPQDVTLMHKGLTVGMCGVCFAYLSLRSEHKLPPHVNYRKRSQKKARAR